MEKTTHIVRSDKGHPDEIRVTGKRKRVHEEVEAVDEERQVQVRSCIDLYLQMAKEMRLRSPINQKIVKERCGCIDLYLQMAKEMRLRRRSNEEECVITGDLNNVRTMYG